MYIDNVRDFRKYKVNVGLALCVLFLCMGFSSRLVPSAFLLQKIIVLGSCVGLIGLLGPDKRFVKNFYFYLVLVFTCYFLRDQYYVGLSFSEFIKAVIGGSLFFLILTVDFKSYIRSVSTAYILLPMIMVPISLVLSKVFGFSLGQPGRFGAGIASAHYAFITYYAVVLACYHCLNKDRFSFLLYGGSLLLLLLSGSRGPLIAALIPSLMLLKFFKRPAFRQKLWFLMPVIILVLIKFISAMIARTEMETFNAEGSFNLSGRDVAWEYFLAQVQGLNLFGGGLGSTTNITQGVREFNLYLFVAPHNEFIRVFLELGYFGVTLFFLNIFLVFKYIFKHATRQTRWFLILAFLGFMVVTIFDNTFSTIQSYVPLALLLKFILTAEGMKIRNDPKQSNRIGVYTHV
ncbi:O-antigen ligase like membrane protein [Vibrio xiamenensis]|uniref:O-antigen ligase like membrane protein n=1 Tax=Vibrio xiamenensis TaxID=861298 RepID=A0A1G8AFI4_9VIBR|nr:O-antigen ligase family protein [Vibrio xiamenensis]SDH19643.1 O-antigen ligase like membrane protein [Vibrio xiamenensis]